MRERMPLSPNIQHYRPQLTSVLSIINRITGVLLGLVAIALVLALWATAAGTHGYENPLSHFLANLFNHFGNFFVTPEPELPSS